MKKTILILSICLLTVFAAQAQLLPKVQVGVKGGVNFTSLSSDNSVFSSNNRAGYLGGIWARFGALGFYFQPEVYVTGKTVEVIQKSSSYPISYDTSGDAQSIQQGMFTTTGSASAKAKFTSIDVPLLFGGKIGAFGFGGRFYAGPLFSFPVDKNSSLRNALGQASSLNYKSSNFALTAGAGIDIRKITIDLRYEAGITKQDYTYNGSANYKTRVSLFNVSLGYAFL